MYKEAKQGNRQQPIKAKQDIANSTENLGCQIRVGKKKEPWDNGE